MDDLMSKIQAMLSDQESMNQIKQLAEMLGSSAAAPPPQNTGGGSPPGGNPTQNSGGMPDLSALLAGLGGGLSGQGASQSSSGGNAAPSGDLGFDIGTLLQLQGLFQSVSSGDKNSDLLMALKPHLKEDKHKKIDQAIKILKLLALWNVVKESGLLKSFDDLL